MGRWVDLLKPRILVICVANEIMLFLSAFLRRALAHKGQQKFSEARSDLQKVLNIEPNNKRAKVKTKYSCW